MREHLLRERVVKASIASLGSVLAFRCFISSWGRRDIDADEPDESELFEGPYNYANIVMYIFIMCMHIITYMYIAYTTYYEYSEARRRGTWRPPR